MRSKRANVLCNNSFIHSFNRSIIIHPPSFWKSHPTQTNNAEKTETILTTTQKNIETCVCDQLLIIKKVTMWNVLFNNGFRLDFG